MIQSQYHLKDGTRLEIYKWQIDNPQAHLVVVHGYAEHAIRYDAFGKYLNRRGINMTSYDQRGHGKSEGPRAYVNRFIQYVQDLKEIETIIDEPFFLMGHSMGGLVLNEYLLTQDIAKIKGAISGSAALEIDPDLSPMLQRLAPILSYFLPKMKLEKLDTTTLTRSPENFEMYHSDPLNYLEGMKARIGAEMLKTIKKNRSLFNKIDVPLLVLHGEGDRIAMPGGSKKLYQDATSSDKTLKLYPGLYHELIHEPEKDQVMKDIAGWILERRIR